MLAVTIILGVLAFLVLILLIPVHVRASFDGQLTARVRLLFVTFKLYPRPEKNEKKKQKKAKKILHKAERKAEKQHERDEDLSRIEQMLCEDGVAAVVSYFAEMARLLGTATKRLLHTITVDKLRLDVLVASDDASQTALDYGRVCAVVYPTEAMLECVVHVRHRVITVTPDFLREKGKVDGEIRLHVLPLRVLWVLCLFFIGYIGNTMTKETAK